MEQLCASNLLDLFSSESWSPDPPVELDPSFRGGTDCGVVGAFPTRISGVCAASLFASVASATRHCRAGGALMARHCRVGAALPSEPAASPPQLPGGHARNR